MSTTAAPAPDYGLLSELEAERLIEATLRGVGAASERQLLAVLKWANTGKVIGGLIELATTGDVDLRLREDGEVLASRRAG